MTLVGMSIISCICILILHIVREKLFYFRKLILNFFLGIFDPPNLTSSYYYTQIWTVQIRIKGVVKHLVYLDACM